MSEHEDRWRDDSPMPGECSACGRRVTFVGSCDCRSAWPVPEPEAEQPAVSGTVEQYRDTLLGEERCRS